ncbi:MAG: chorismate mutase [Alphaproteobacteria bacterium]|nr:MAG: chorismate mutase [Alphaproteobacteria bacterium]
MSKTLSEIRVEIDSIDNQVHDLLMQRADLVSSVARAKKKEGLQIVHPAREAKLMRRLLSRHKQPLPRATVVRIWRELISSVSLLQTGLSVVVSAEAEEGSAYWDMAKNYFGSAIPMKNILGDMNTIVEVRDGDAYFAVLPWPELVDDSPWWAPFLDQNTEEKLSIICALPYGQVKIDNDVGRHKRGVVVSKIDFMPSDDDVSFIGVKLSVEASRARIKDAAKVAGFSVISLFSGHDSYLLEVEGYHNQDSDLIRKLQDALGDECLYCKAVGGYPVIPDTT